MLVAEDESKLFRELIFLLEKLWLLDFTLDSIKLISIFMQERKNGLFFDFPLLLVFIRHINKLIGLVVKKLELSQSLLLINMKLLNFRGFMELFSDTFIVLEPTNLFTSQYFYKLTFL